MTSKERENYERLTGLKSISDLEPIVRSLNQLEGKFTQFVDDERQRWEEIQDWMQDEPARIADGSNAAVAACRAAAEPEVRKAVAFYEDQKREEDDEKAVRHWLTARAFAGLMTLIIAAFIVAVVLLFVSHRDEAATVVAMIGVASPLALSLLRRS